MRQITHRQYTVLITLETHQRLTARQIGVREDVLWRLEERGFTRRNSHDQWLITDKGLAALAAEDERINKGLN